MAIAVSLRNDYEAAKVSSVSCSEHPPLIRRCGHLHPQSHAILRLPAPTYSRTRCNLKDLLPQLEGLTGELHAILLSSRLETAARTARSLRLGNAKPPAPVRTIAPRTPDVTNVVKSEHFQSFNTGSCYKRRQTKSKTSVFWRNIVWIDDVCNNRPWRPTKSRSN